MGYKKTEFKPKDTLPANVINAMQDTIIKNEANVGLSSYLAFVGNVNAEQVSAALGKNNEDTVVGVGCGLAMYARYKEPTIDIDTSFAALTECNALKDVDAKAICEIVNDTNLFTLINVNPYGKAIFDERVLETFDNELGVGFATGENVVLDKNLTYTPYTFSNDGKIGGKYKFSSLTMNARTFMKWQTAAFTLTENQQMLHLKPTLTASGVPDATFKISVVNAETDAEIWSWSGQRFYYQSQAKYWIPLQNVSSIKICFEYTSNSQSSYSSSSYVDFSLDYIGLA